jgi:hypothetical protein
LGSSRSRTLHLIVFLFLAALSLRPWKSFEDKIEVAFEPARALRGLTLPLAWLSAREVRAAETALLAGEDSRRATGRAVLASAQTSAAPADLALARGRGLIHAEVVARALDDPNRAIVRFAPGSEVARGMPAVCGDFYVGRVVSVDPSRPGEGAIDLVTGKDFRVGGAVFDPGSGSGGRTAGEPALLVVGGVVPRGREKAELLLATHCPSDPSLAAGLVRVREIDAPGNDPYRGLADGFRLGSLERVQRGGTNLLAVRPGLDYSSGLFQIAVVCPSQHAAAGLNLAQDPFVEDRWLDGHLALAGDPSFWREGRVLSAGTDQGVEDGAALSLGASFLGCVVRAGHSTSKVRLLGDAGLEFSALANPESGGRPLAPGTSDAPFTIGRLVSLGRDRSDGVLLLRWEAAIPLEMDGSNGPVQAVLYTASGQRAVPPGLRIGTTVLPRGRGPFLLRVRQEQDGLSFTRVRVWRGLRASGRPDGQENDRP